MGKTVLQFLQEKLGLDWNPDMVFVTDNPRVQDPPNVKDLEISKFDGKTLIITIKTHGCG